MSTRRKIRAVKKAPIKKPCVIEARERFINMDVVEKLRELLSLAEDGVIHGIVFAVSARKGRTQSGFDGRIDDSAEALTGHLMRLVDDMCFIADRRDGIR